MKDPAGKYRGEFKWGFPIEQVCALITGDCDKHIQFQNLTALSLEGFWDETPLH